MWRGRPRPRDSVNGAADISFVSELKMPGHGKNLDPGKPRSKAAGEGARATLGPI